MHKILAMFAVALGVIAISAGSAFAGCRSPAAQSVSLETKTASIGSTGAQTPQTPVPEIRTN